MNSFDKKIKEKLESLPVSGADEAWARLAPNLPKPFYMHFLQNYAGWMMALGLTTILIFQQNKNNDLALKLNQLKRYQNESLALKNVKADTFFTEKIIYKDKLVYVKNKNQEDVLKYNKIETPFENLISDEQDAIFISNLGKKEDQNIALEETKVNSNAMLSKKEILSGKLQNEKMNEIQRSENHTSPLLIKTLKNKTLEKMAINPIPSEEKSIDKITRTTELETKTLENTAKENQSEFQTPNKNLSSQELPKQSKNIEVAVVEDIEKPSKKITRIDEPNKNHAVDFKTKKSVFKNLNARVGLQVGGSFDERISIGPTLEIFLNKNFSFSSGVFYTNSESRKIKQVQEFNKRTGKRFEDFYKQKIDGKAKEIKNIEIQTASIVVPIQSNYYFKLKNNFSIQISAAALLNFNEKDEVVFESKYLLEDLYKNRFENKRNSSVFYGFNYGAGLQYRYKRLSFNILPTLEFPFSKSLFLNERNRFNVNTSLKFALKK